MKTNTAKTKTKVASYFIGEEDRLVMVGYFRKNRLQLAKTLTGAIEAETRGAGDLARIRVLAQLQYELLASPDSEAFEFVVEEWEKLAKEARYGLVEMRPPRAIH